MKNLLNWFKNNWFKLGILICAAVVAYALWSFIDDPLIRHKVMIFEPRGGALPNLPNLVPDSF